MDIMNIATPTTTQIVELFAHYDSDKSAKVLGKRWPNGDIWITRRQLVAAERRAGLIGGDHLVHMGGDKRDGYLVAQAYVN